MNNIIIGNHISRLLVAVLLFFCHATSATVQLQITDLQSRPLNSVGINQQFLIHFRAENVSSQVEPFIKNSEKVHAQKTGVSLSTINGVSSVRYSYLCYADQLGTITIGPAQIQTKGTTQQSNVLNIVVTEQASINQPQKQTAFEPIVELSVDQTSAYVGQKIKVKLRFLYDQQHPQGINLKQIVPPALKNIDIEQISQDASQGFAIHQQKPYQYIEWEWLLYPHEEGTLTLAPYGIDYEIEEENEERSFFGAFSFMFKPKNIKRTYSNTVTIQVKPVPLYHNRSVDAVGDFEKIKAQVSLKNIVQQDATELTLSLYGSEAYFDSLPFLPLQNMPTSCRFYESQSKTETLTNQQKAKHFSYIIQPNEAGTFTIPAQEYVTFNPTTEKHTLLHTKPLRVMVTPRPITPTKQIHTTTKETVLPHKNPQPCTPSQFMLIKKSRQITLCIPWILFWILAFLIITSNIIGLYTKQCFRWCRKIIIYYFAYFIARKAIKRLRTTNNTQSLESVFITLIKHRQQLADKQAGLLAIQQWLYEKEYSQETVEKWNMFVKIIHMHQFGRELIAHHEPKSHHALFEQSLFWLHILQKGGF